jgi:hypothetical protein
MEDLHYYQDLSPGFALIENLSKGIRVIGDPSVEDAKKEIKEIVDKSKIIFFCGFGYAKENLEVIGLPGSIDDKWKIFGTAKGMREKEREGVKRLLGRNYKKSAVLENWVRIEDRNSYDLLREHL